MIKTYLKWLSPRFQMFTGAYDLRKAAMLVQAAEYRRLQDTAAVETPGNVACSGFKVYSQTDEDGIIAEIYRRLGGGRTFLEIGVQTGVECNSLYLLLQGWRGCWVEGSPRYVNAIRGMLGDTSFLPRFEVINAFVKRDNIAELYKRACRVTGSDQLDFFSLDIDGNDLHVLETLLETGARPRVICVEYNGRFPPPLSLSIRYADDHVWDETDYLGSSLQAFVDLLSGHKYRLVTCNLPGINAFFVADEIAGGFPTFTTEQLYQPYRHYLSPFPSAQPPTLAYLRDLLAA